MKYLFVIIYLLGLSVNVFAQQEFYKIYLHDEGIYKISGQDLMDAGISINQIDPAKIQIYSDGNEILPYSTTESTPHLNEISIEISAGNDSIFNANDFILFYGQSLNRYQKSDYSNDFEYISNPYDTLSCYWMRFNVENGKRIIKKQSTPANPSAIVKDTFLERIHFEEDEFNPLKSGLTWTWNLFEGYDFFDFIYNLTSVEALSAELEVRFSKYDFYGYFVNTGQVEILSNGSLVGSYDVNTSANYITIIPIQSNQNLLRFNYIPFSSQDTLPQVGIDWLELKVERSSEIYGNGQKIFIDSLNSAIHLKYNCVSNPDSVSIFDISDPFNLNHLISLNDTLFEDTLFNESKLYYLQKYNMYKQVLSIELSSRDIFSPADGADYIIVCPDEWRSELTPLQTHRSIYNGFVSKIVSIEDVFEQFGYGRKDPTAIRNFIKFAYENWNPQPQYILLAGNGYYDYKDITGDYSENWIPPFEIDANLNEINSRAVDDYYVDMNFTISKLKNTEYLLELIPGLWKNMNYNKHSDYSDLYTESFDLITPDLAIGRLPADNTSEMIDLVQKTIIYEANFKPGLWRMSSLLISDDENPDGYIFLYQTELLYENYLSDISRVMKLYETDYSLIGNEKPDATNNLINYINEGNRITTFSGHAIESQWTHENLLNINRDMLKIRNKEKYPFYIGMGKLYKYDDLEESILDILIKNKVSGFIGTLTANRLVYSSASSALFNSFMSNIIDDGNTLGEALLLSKNGSINPQKYHLLGDPALSISFPQKKSVIINISPDTIKAGCLIQISGQILEPIDEDSLVVEIRQPGELQNAGTITYEQTGNTIYRGKVFLNNNSFSTQFIVPVNSYSDTIRVGGNLFGYLWDNDSESSIIHDSLIFGGLDTSIVDSIPPMISLSAMKKDTTKNPTVLHAELFDVSGINLAQNTNAQPILIFDNNADSINVSGFFMYNVGSYQEGKIDYPIPQLDMGTHSATLIVQDNFGNTAIDSLHFIISGKGDPNPEIPSGFTLHQNYPNPFNLETNIGFEITGYDLYDLKIEIFNILGQKIFEVIRQGLSSGSYEWVWNGKNFNNNVVSSGVYIYRITANTLNYSSKSIIKSKKMLLIK